MSIVRVGSTQKFSDGWDSAFGGGKKTKSVKKKATKKKATSGKKAVQKKSKKSRRN